MKKIQNNDNDRYLRLFETAQDGILILKYPDGEIIDANPFILNLLDCDLSSIKNKKLWELGFIKDKEQALVMYKELIDKGYLRYENLSLQKKNGDVLPVEFICNSYKVGNDSVIQCNIRDISDRVRFKNLEEKLLVTKITNLNEIINCLSAIVESRDPYTAGHQFRVADLAVQIAKHMNLSDFQITGISLAARLHDIGKFRIPLELLVKPTKLIQEEFELVKLHPFIGASILKNIGFEQDVSRFVLEHHERLDGSGYPYGLKGSKISLEAKIIMVADVLEALTTYRPYRKPLELRLALQELTNNQDKLYDLDVVNACVHLLINNNYNFPIYKLISDLD